MLLLSLYAFAIWLLGDFVKPMNLTSDEANRQIGNSYLETDERFRHVIVGSSMAARLSPEEFGASTFIMAFVGRGALDGMQLIGFRETRLTFFWLKSS